LLISAIVVVLLWGPPALVAAYPAVCALIQRRPDLAAVLLVFGEVIAFIVPAIVDRWQTAELTRRGHIADSIAFIFYPWMYSLPWAEPWLWRLLAENRSQRRRQTPILLVA
jgi:hypothetical protein